MISEQERWAEALAMLEMQGDAAERFISDRVAALADDPVGVARRQEIALWLAEIRAANARRR